jgi:hypothetical protein
MHRLRTRVLTDQTAIGIIPIAAAVLVMRATGMTPGSLSVLKEKRPDARAANSNPSDAEYPQLIAAASNILFATVIIVHQD